MSNKARMQIMGPQHEDIKYLQQDDIGAIIAKGLADTYSAYPTNPIEYFGKWLMNYQAAQKAKTAEAEKVIEIKSLKQKREDEIKIAEGKKKEAELAVEMTERENAAFWTKLTESDDLVDNLTELTNYIHRNIKATGVYIGQLEPPMKPIEDDAGEDDHIDTEAPLVLKFKHSNTDHESCMVGAVLTNDKGITHTLFVEGEDAEADAVEDEEGEEGVTKPKVDKTDVLNTAKFKYVPEVVEEQRIQFWKVPRLGAFMAVPIVYKSCLFEGALDQAILDMTEVQAEIARLEEEREANDGVAPEEGKEPEGTNEDGEEAEKPPIVVEPPPFQTQENKFVLCIDTLGQDRELTDDQKRFVLNTAQQFKETWEKFEHDKLTADRDSRIKTQKEDKAWIEENLEGLKEEEEKFVDDKLAEYDEFDDDDQKNLLSDKQHLQFQAMIFKEREEFQTRLDEFKRCKILKFGKFMQSLFYLLGFQKEQVTEPGTQKFNWKKAKTLITEEFLDKMCAYEFMGPKDGEFKSYQTLNYIQKNIEGIVLADVEAVSMVAGRLFKWLQLAIDNRKLDITRRKALVQRERDEADNKLKAKEEREKKRETDLEEAKKKFEDDHKDEIDAFNAHKASQETGVDEYAEEDDDEGEGKEKDVPVMPVFDLEEFQEGWEAENPEIIIQDVVVDDIDNDWTLTEEEIETSLKDFWAARADV